MLKKKKDKEPEFSEGNGHSEEMLGLLKSVVAHQQDLSDRLDELEDKKSNDKELAHLKMVNLTYDTPDKHLSELTRIPLSSVRPLVTDIVLDSLLNPDVMSGVKSLGEVQREAYYRLMRSVGGVHLGRGVRIAEQQAAAQAEEDTLEHELGGA